MQEYGTPQAPHQGQQIGSAEPDVLRAICGTEKAVTLVQEALDRLEARCAPVLRSEKETTGAGQVPRAAAKCPVSGRIQDIEAALGVVAFRIVGLTGRLEV